MTALALSLLASPAWCASGAARNAVLFLGDSVTLGLGVEDAQAYPALIGARWKKEGLPWVSRTFGVIGGETADVRDSLDFTLADADLTLVVLSIGGNDGIDHIAPAKVRSNLEMIIKTVQAKGIPVVLVAMKADPAKDAQYASDFDRIFPELAAQYRIKLVPFPLNGIFKNPKMTVDLLHPNAAGQRLVADRVYSFFNKEKLP